MSQQKHIMSHDGVYVIYLAVMIGVLTVIGMNLAFHG